MDTKKYKMLNTVAGSRDGLKVETFTKGETYDLNPELAEQFFHQGAITEVGSGGKANPAEKRETKVSGPSETKVIAPSESKEGEAGVPTETQRIEELNSVARDHYGLDTDTKMPRAELKEVVDEAGDKTKAKPHAKPKK